MVVTGLHCKLIGCSSPGKILYCLQDGGGHVTPEEAHSILEAGPRP
jgi:hypothetical protein